VLVKTNGISSASASAAAAAAAAAVPLHALGLVASYLLVLAPHEYSEGPSSFRW